MGNFSGSTTPEQDRALDRLAAHYNREQKKDNPAHVDISGPDYLILRVNQLLADYLDSTLSEEGEELQEAFRRADKATRDTVRAALGL